ncbi:MAG TPA: hypothetical protein P5316_07745 [Phycisphaerae bacterium]|nr:hypothetical protein [Phycisphaerae bacterium]
MTRNHPAHRCTERFRLCPYAVLFLSLLVVTDAAPSFADSAQSADQLVEIRGGADETRQNYEWTVINKHSLAIVEVEFPHYHADLFQIIPPAGWEQECTYLVNVGVPDRPGVCIARRKPPNPGIPPGGQHLFAMRLTAKGALVGKGKVTIKFADDRTVIVPGVTLPVPPPPSFKLLPLLGAAIIFGLWVLVRTVRERRRKGQRTEGPVAGSQVEQKPES